MAGDYYTCATNIYLADSSIAENIAYGIPPHQIDLARVKNAAEQAQIASYHIESSPEVQELRGEQGIRLSGGSGSGSVLPGHCISSRVLVLDEATSALDMATEQALMDGKPAKQGPYDRDDCSPIEYG